MLLHIKELMVLYEITATELADSIGCTRQTISNIIHGKTFPNEERIKDIAMTFGVPVWRLFLDPNGNVPVIGSDGHTIRCPHCFRDIEIRAVKQ